MRFTGNGIGHKNFQELLADFHKDIKGAFHPKGVVMDSDSEPEHDREKTLPCMWTMRTIARRVLAVMRMARKTWVIWRRKPMMIIYSIQMGKDCFIIEL